MGDRCYVTVVCKQDDREAFEELGLDPDCGTDREAPVVTLAAAEMNGGASDEMEHLAEQGLTFDYASDAGDEYGPALMVAHAGAWQVVERVHDSRCPAVTVVDADGTLNEGMLRDARAYWRIKALVDAEFARVTSRGRSGDGGDGAGECSAVRASKRSTAVCM